MNNNKGEINMLKKEQILKILNKYGFYSFNRAPYLYQKGEELGVYFIWQHKHFGTLERVLTFLDETSLDEEIFKYWWFLNHKKELDIEVEFDQYDSLSPKVNYKINNIPYTVEMMKSNASQEKDDLKDNIYYKQLYRTANILIMILQEKFKLQNETFFKVMDLQEKLNKVETKYQKKLNEYNKTKADISESYEVLTDNYDNSEVLATNLYNELAGLSTIEELQTFINSMFSYLLTIDSSETHLQNIYLLNRYPYEIKDFEQKIEILTNASSSKKRIFKQKQNVLDLLKEVDDTSPCKKMINVNLYIEKEKKRLEEKYANCTKIDLIILGDYLVDLEKIKLDLPPMLEPIKEEESYNQDTVLTEIKNKYESLTKLEKSACHVASSFLGECLNILYELKIYNLNFQKIFKKLNDENKIEPFNEAFQYLDFYLNAKIRVKYLSIIKIATFEEFVISLCHAIQILERINITLPASFIAYYNHKEKDILPIYLNSLYYFHTKESYLVKIAPNVPIYYSPVQIIKSLDIIENKELVVRENEILWTLKDKINIETNDKVKKVVNYKKDRVIKRKNVIIVTDMKVENECIYYEDLLSPFKNGGRYE